MWPSHRIGAIAIDKATVAVELAEIAALGGFVDSYTEFVCGSWCTCMLWNASGDSTDFRVHDYPGPAQPTEYARKLTYILKIINERFNLNGLRFARLARLGPGSFVVPHRDYLELDSNLTRIHVPLETDDGVYTSEESTVYRMAFGEVWFLDATKVHSIGSFSTANRTHLILDFADTEPRSAARISEPEPEIFPAGSIVSRRGLHVGEEDAFLALSKIIDTTNLRDILAMLVKRHFLVEIEAADVFRWLTEIAERSGDQEVLSQAQWLAGHCISAR